MDLKRKMGTSKTTSVNISDLSRGQKIRQNVNRKIYFKFLLSFFHKIDIIIIKFGYRCHEIVVYRRLVGHIPLKDVFFIFLCGFSVVDFLCLSAVDHFTETLPPSLHHKFNENYSFDIFTLFVLSFFLHKIYFLFKYDKDIIIFVFASCFNFQFWFHSLLCYCRKIDSY